MKSDKIIFIVLGSIFIVGLILALIRGQKPKIQQEAKTNNNQLSITITGMTDQKSKTYNLAEIAKHTAKDDCWFAVDGKVYDVTAYIKMAKHPGGTAIIEGCGKDATELFNTRPMGSKTSHSQKARDFLREYYIGDLQE